MEETISVFELIKVGIGPSSSHTMGPWRSSLFFLEYLEEKEVLHKIQRIRIHLFGSLAKTGIGHGTDLAAVVGLRGEHYRIVDTTKVESYFREIYENKKIDISTINGSRHTIHFDIKEDVVFHFTEEITTHPNTMRFDAYLDTGEILQREYYSVGGGFVMTEDSSSIAKLPKPSKYPCHSAADVIRYTKELNISFAELVYINECSWQSESEIHDALEELKNEMLQSIERGINTDGELPGGLFVKRRAAAMSEKLAKGKRFKKIDNLIDFLQRHAFKNFVNINKWISCFALAVNEENAAFGRIVTAPTNGAAGVIPAVMMYAICFEEDVDDEKIHDFLLIAGEIGTLFKKGATISAAMGGCQAEIGVSSSMAAAGLTAVLGGSTGQILMAAEIAMEHHLGMTCDPVKGLVQIPCIERNAMGAIKAITASYLAMERDPDDAKVSLDAIIKTMKETALDMNTKYKETSEGGLAISVNLPEC